MNALRPTCPSPDQLYITAEKNPSYTCRSTHVYTATFKPHYTPRSSQFASERNAPRVAVRRSALSCVLYIKMLMHVC